MGLSQAGAARQVSWLEPVASQLGGGRDTARPVAQVPAPTNRTVNSEPLVPRRVGAVEEHLFVAKRGSLYQKGPFQNAGAENVLGAGMGSTRATKPDHTGDCPEMVPRNPVGSR